MNIEIKEISESDYNKLKYPVLFENKLTDRVFGIISNGINEYKFSWQSTIIKPKVIDVDDFRCSISIDLVFLIFEFLTGKILLQLTLDYFFYDTKIYNGFIYVITELEIIKISTKDLLVIERFALPDYFENIEFNEEIILVKCVGDEIVNIKL